MSKTVAAVRSTLTPAVLICTALLPLFSCDCFFEARGRVVECGTATPIPAVAISVRIDRGFRGMQSMGVVVFKTDNQGSFRVTTGQPCESWVTLMFQKDGYAGVENQMKGAPKSDLEICMARSPVP